MEILEAWADLYDGKWSGLVVTPKPGLDERIVLTAWTHRYDAYLIACVLRQRCGLLTLQRSLAEAAASAGVDVAEVS